MNRSETFVADSQLTASGSSTKLHRPFNTTWINRELVGFFSPTKNQTFWNSEVSCRKCSISGRITCSRRFATRCVPGGLGSRPVRWNSNAGKSKFLIAESDPGPRGNMGQPWWGGSRIHPKHPKAHVGSIFNSGGLVRHQDFWIILPWILWNFCTYVCTCLSPVFFVTGVLVLSCTVFSKDLTVFCLVSLKYHPFVFVLFFCAPEDVSFWNPIDLKAPKYISISK